MTQQTCLYHLCDQPGTEIKPSWRQGFRFCPLHAAQALKTLNRPQRRNLDPGLIYARFYEHLFAGGAG